MGELGLPHDTLAEGAWYTPQLGSQCHLQKKEKLCAWVTEPVHTTCEVLYGLLSLRRALVMRSSQLSHAQQKEVQHPDLMGAWHAQTVCQRN
jgi:hypothetical protein